MPVKKCILEGSTIRSLNDLYDQLDRCLPLPEHFGRNLDAFWDTLSTDVEGPFEIVWKHTNEAKKRLGRDFDKVVRLLRDVEKEREDFTLKMEQ